MAAPSRKNVFLTGGSSGIGRATAELLVARGYSVWATARRKDSLPAGVRALEMDLAVPASIDRAWHAALVEAGQIDVVVQNAGLGIFGAIEDVSAEDASALWQVLVHGPLRVLQRAAEHLRPRRAGVILAVSSLAAELPLPFGAHYSAGKAALSALLGGLTMELEPFGVRVVDFRPGDIRTAFNDRLAPTLPKDSDYLPWVRAAWAESCRLMDGAPEPAFAARAIVRAIEHPRALLRCGTFFQATLGAWGARFLPRAILLDSIRGYFHLHHVDRGQRKP